MFRGIDPDLAPDLLRTLSQKPEKCPEPCDVMELGIKDLGVLLQIVRAFR